MTTVTYKIPNISCHHCVNTISMELGDLPGVKSVQGDVDTRQVVVIFDSPATIEELEKTLTEIDYPPEK